MSNGEPATSFDFPITNFGSIQNKSKTEKFSLILPTNFSKLHLNLSTNQILDAGFQITEKNGMIETVNKSILPGEFYHGTVVGHPNSYVSLNINTNKISGIVRTSKRVFNIAYDHKSKKQIIYEQKSITDLESFTCDQVTTDKTNSLPIYKNLKSNVSCGNAVTVYFECDFDMFQNLNSSTQEVVDYALNVFNEVNLIYAVEEIPLLISQIAVWTSDDPYTDNKTGIYDFADSLIVNSFPGDIAQLLTNDAGNNGGTAYVDQLCGLLPFSYCDIVNSQETYPTYSWDVQVMAHELGHTFGSHHTHDCVWGANGDAQIDDCGNIANGSNAACYDPSNPIIPSEGGTVMSYCHTDPVGIDFLNGFGDEPGALIRLNHQTCFCDNSQCNAATQINANGTYYAHPSDGNGASTSNATHADWFVFEPSYDGIISVGSCDEGVDTRVWLWEGDCNGLNYVAISDDDCHSGNGSNYASQLVDHPVEVGKTYFLEWDNRWSNNAFNWEFDYQVDSTIVCDSTYIVLTGTIVDSIQLHAQMDLQSSNHITNNSQTHLKAGESIDLLPGFELSIGATLELSIENCENQ